MCSARPLPRGALLVYGPNTWTSFSSRMSCLLTALALIVALLVAGGAAFLEHPERPEKEDSASIWRLEQMRRILLSPAATLEHILQGPLGQVSPKPTHILAVRNLHFMLCVRRLTIRGRNVQAAPQNLEDEGFSTSLLKEYPPRLSAAFLASFW